MRRSGLLSLLAAAAPAPAIAATLDVPAAFSTIAAAVQAAGAGDTVVVAPGTYAEHDVFLGSGVVVRGASGDPADVTVDAGGLGRGFACLDVDASTALIALTITNGFTTGHGGALFGVRSDLRVENCRFVGNRSGNWGGAIAFQQSSSPVLVGCEIADNEGNYAGGMYCEGGDAVLQDCVFRDNRAIHTGGAFLSFAPASRPRLERCVFLANEAQFGHGGAVSANYGSPSIERCTFHGNSAFDLGGAIHAWHGAVVTVTRSILAFSRGVESVWCSESSAIEISCSDVFKNDLGDWVGCIEDARRDNLSADPLFCDAEAGDLRLRADSPCAPPGPDGCGTIGALDVGCGPVPVETLSWGRVKQRFR